MNITCNNCESKFKISDDKMPPGTTATLRCPKCKSKISVTSNREKENFGFDASDTGTDSSNFSFSDDKSDTYDDSETPFDFAEEEGKTALICETDPELIKQMTTVLKYLEYHTITAKNAREAIKLMRYNSYNLIVVNENFDTKSPDSNGILIYLERLHMLIRRYIFIILITDRFLTMDNMTALYRSVNVVINTKHMKNFDNILRRSLSDNDMFYKIYLETLKNSGRV